MNNLINYLFAILVLFSLTTCKKPLKDIPPSLTLNPTTKEIDVNAGNFIIFTINLYQ